MLFVTYQTVTLMRLTEQRENRSDRSARRPHICTHSPVEQERCVCVCVRGCWSESTSGSEYNLNIFSLLLFCLNNKEHSHTSMSSLGPPSCTCTSWISCLHSPKCEFYKTPYCFSAFLRRLCDLLLAHPAGNWSSRSASVQMFLWTVPEGSAFVAIFIHFTHFLKFWSKSMLDIIATFILLANFKYWNPNLALFFNGLVFISSKLMFWKQIVKYF